MKHNGKKNLLPAHHNRQSIRLPEYDYSQPGAYFVTICEQGRECVLGQIIDGEMIVNPIGQIAAAGWNWLGEKFQTVKVDIFCVMPNHVHAIISIIEMEEKNSGRGGLQTAPTDEMQKSIISRAKPLGRLVGAYKTHTTSQINLIRSTPGEKFWQRNYFERVIRNQKEFDAIYEYIQANPLRWGEDENHPANLNS